MSIDRIIARLSSENSYITPEQIVRARDIYGNDLRTIDEIEAELLRLSKEIKIAGKEREKVAQMIAQREATSHKNKNEIFPNNQPQDISKNELNNNQDVETTPTIDTQYYSSDKIEDDLSDLYAPSRSQLTYIGGRLGQTFLADDPLAQRDPTDELDLMFSETATSENDFERVATLGEKNNVHVKRFEDGLRNPNHEGKDESGFSTANSLVTITLLFSLMCIIISLLIIYTN